MFCVRHGSWFSEGRYCNPGRGRFRSWQHDSTAHAAGSTGFSFILVSSGACARATVIVSTFYSCRRHGSCHVCHTNGASPKLGLFVLHTYVSRGPRVIQAVIWCRFSFVLEHTFAYKMSTRYNIPGRIIRVRALNPCVHQWPCLALFHTVWCAGFSAVRSVKRAHNTHRDVEPDQNRRRAPNGPGVAVFSLLSVTITKDALAW